MSRKRTKGNSYNLRVNSGQYGRKRTRSTFMHRVQHETSQPTLFGPEPTTCELEGHDWYQAEWMDIPKCIRCGELFKNR